MSNGTANLISDHGDKLELLNNLSNNINGTVYLEMRCEENNDPTNAKNYATRRATLNTQHDALLRALLQDWIGDAAAVKAEMETATEGVNASVKQVQQNVNTAQAIVKALGYLDQAITIAAKLLAP